MTMKKLLLITALTVLSAPAYAKDYTVQMVSDPNDRFIPDKLTIQPGDTVNFVNAQKDKHDVMFEAVPKGAELAMSPTLKQKGESWSYTFKIPGTYDYHCHPHEIYGMNGQIIVSQPLKSEDQKHDEDRDHVEQGSTMKGMDHHGHAEMADMSGMSGMEGMDMGSMDHFMPMKGFYGTYPMTREASGTSWLPESSPMEGIHGMYGDWMTMVHGYANLVYDYQGGKRGTDKTFGEGMMMGMASRPLGDGTWGLRAMLSPDPLMGKSGYPLLLQTGETANGRDHLTDRQHPHDLFMELATTYSHPITSDNSAFVYLGYPGEPALGPATFMHRLSGIDNPEAPIGHHWLDSAHITFGVATVGYVWQDWKLETSVFNGREPDQYRWNFDEMRLNSYSGRLTWNPTSDWSMQVSQGYIKSPEALEPNIDQNRTTASATYNKPFDKGNWQTTAAWGMNNNNPGHTSNALLLETSVSWQDKHTVFSRAEWVQKDELFEDPSPQAGTEYNVGKLSVGYIYDIPLAEHLKIGIGGLGSVYALPNGLDKSYGQDPASGMAFIRLKIK
jgi:plastocyanin